MSVSVNCGNKWISVLVRTMWVFAKTVPYNKQTSGLLEATYWYYLSVSLITYNSILIIYKHIQYYLDLLHVATYSDKMTQTEAPKKIMGVYSLITQYFHTYYADERGKEHS